jgi:hypothetical protein
MSRDEDLVCPAAPPHWTRAAAFAVVVGTPERPALAYLEQPVPATPELLAKASPATPREIFRFSSSCHKDSCPHWTEEGSGRCTLAATVLKEFDPVAEKLPRCSIRKSCRWWYQEGKAACIRCVQIPTDLGELPDDEVASFYLADPRYFQPEKLLNGGRVVISEQVATDEDRYEQCRNIRPS